ncbi:hypothetical protein D3C72_1512250 [compost metagenome]
MKTSTACPGNWMRSGATCGCCSTRCSRATPRAKRPGCAASISVRRRPAPAAPNPGSSLPTTCRRHAACSRACSGASVFSPSRAWPRRYRASCTCVSAGSGWSPAAPWWSARSGWWRCSGSGRTASATRASSRACCRSPRTPMWCSRTRHAAKSRRDAISRGSGTCCRAPRAGTSCRWPIPRPGSRP